MPTRLEGLGAVVTGASSGIGRAIAIELARRGARVALVGRDVRALEATARDIDREGGRAAVVLPADLSVRGEPVRVAKEADKLLGGVDILVNNAAVQMFAAIEAAGDGEEARTIIETNLFAPLALIAALVPDMRLRKRGCIVDVSSLAATMQTPMSGAYSASKAALGSITETLRLELAGTGVDVLHVFLGPVETPMFAEGRAIAADIIDRTPRGKPDVLARRIADAIERRGRLVVYPRWTWIGRLLPSLARAAAAHTFRNLPIDRERILTSGAVRQAAALE